MEKTERKRRCENGNVHGQKPGNFIFDPKTAVRKGLFLSTLQYFRHKYRAERRGADGRTDSVDVDVDVG